MNDTTPPELARGYIEHLEYVNGYLFIKGWMFLPGESYDGIAIEINNVLSGNARLIERPDVQEAFPGIEVPLKSGFEFNSVMPEEMFTKWVTLDILGMNCGREIASFQTIFLRNFFSSLPEPPAELKFRVTNEKSSMFYWCGGAKIYGEFTKAIDKYQHAMSVKKLLDWGCGCGRVTSLFLKYSGIPEIYGSDIDREAIEWCTEHLRLGHFLCINPYPPTKYAENMFDTVIGCSVFTHLSRDVQYLWLEEIKRILKPNGYFFTSVHGPFATLFASSDVQEEAEKNGISDSSMDSNLDGVAPDGYYRGVYQSKTYTLQEWGKHFKMIDYIDRGMGNFQDLVIMQK